MVIPESVAAKKPEDALKKESAQQEEIRIDLKNYGTQLLTREAGTTIRADVASVVFHK